MTLRPRMTPSATEKTHMGHGTGCGRDRGGSRWLDSTTQSVREHWKTCTDNWPWLMAAGLQSLRTQLTARELGETWIDKVGKSNILAKTLKQFPRSSVKRPAFQTTVAIWDHHWSPLITCIWLEDEVICNHWLEPLNDSAPACHKRHIIACPRDCQLTCHHQRWQARATSSKVAFEVPSLFRTFFVLRINPYHP